MAAIFKESRIVVDDRSQLWDRAKFCFESLANTYFSVNGGIKNDLTKFYSKGIKFLSKLISITFQLN